MYSMDSGNLPQKKSGETNTLNKVSPSLQVLVFCGPDKERCVANQTLRDENCLIPCSGLYADVADDSLKQTMQAFDQTVIRGSVNM